MAHTRKRNKKTLVRLGSFDTDTWQGWMAADSGVIPFNPHATPKWKSGWEAWHRHNAKLINIRKHNVNHPVSKQRYQDGLRYDLWLARRASSSVMGRAA